MKITEQPTHLLPEHASPAPDLLDVSNTFGNVVVNPPSPKTQRRLIAGGGIALFGLLASAAATQGGAEDTRQEPEPATSYADIIDTDSLIPDLDEPFETVIEIEAPTEPTEVLTQDQRDRVADKLEREPSVLENMRTLKPAYDDVQKQTGVDWKI